MQNTPPPQDLLTFLWIALGAMATVLGATIRQYLVNDRRWSDKYDALVETSIEIGKESLNTVNNLSQELQAIREGLAVSKQLDELAESFRRERQ